MQRPSPKLRVQAIGPSLSRTSASTDPIRRIPECQGGSKCSSRSWRKSSSPWPATSQILHRGSLPPPGFQCYESNQPRTLATNPMTRANPLVSVVLPTRNRPDRLGRALASVLRQSYTRFEVLIVDDASTIPADELVDRVAPGDRRVKVKRLSERAGAAAARNAAFADAQGDVVAFIDDDDEWKPQKLERQLAFFYDHPSVGILTADFEIQDERKSARIIQYRGPQSLTPAHLLWFNLPGSFICGTLRRSAVGDELWLDQSFPSVEDWDMWVRCSRHTTIGIVKEILGRVTIHTEERLSDPASELQGLKAFERRHQASMSNACLAFLRAHQRMEMGKGWRKRFNVLRSIVTPSAGASTLILIEQVSRQLGMFRADPGLVERTIARALSFD